MRPVGWCQGSVTIRAPLLLPGSGQAAGTPNGLDRLSGVSPEDQVH